MKKATVIAVITVILLLAHWAQGGVSMVRNGSFENDGEIYSITEEDSPQYWCDVNLPDNFGGWVNGIYWSTHDGNSLTLYSEMFATFAAGDIALVSQQVYLTGVNEIIFDLNLSTIYGPELWDPSRSAVVLIDGNIVWDSNNILGSDANGVYPNQIVDVNEIYKDADSHILSLGIRVNASEYSIVQYWAQWDFVKFDAHCGGFGYLPEDLNRDCYVDIFDLGMLAEEWLAEGPAYNCDLLADDESIVNLRDFAVFASYWRDNTDWRNWQDDNCYEMELLAGDIDDSGEVYYGDILMLADNWLSEGRCIRADINEDDVVDFLDFAIIADEWRLRSWLYGLK